MNIIIKMPKNNIDTEISIIFFIQLFKTLSRNTNSSTFQTAKDRISLLTSLFIGYQLCSRAI